MSRTEEQKAFHVRKMRARMAKLDVDKDGYISKGDFDKMSENMISYFEIPSNQAASIYSAFNVVAAMVGVKPGEKRTIEEAAQMATHGVFCRTPEETRQMVDNTHGPLFEAIDSNGDGYISLKEFKLCCKIFEYNHDDAEITHPFNLIDTDKDGKISREEFLAAMDDFLHGVAETEVSKAFCGPLI